MEKEQAEAFSYLWQYCKSVAQFAVEEYRSLWSEEQLHSGRDGAKEPLADSAWQEPEQLQDHGQTPLF